MKRLLILLLSLLGVFNALGQMKDPVKWTTSVEKISDTEFDLVMKAVIEPEWHVYSQFTPDGGALPIVMTFKEQKGNYQLVGKTKESPYKKHFNDIFEVEEFYFEKAFTLTQRVKLTNPKLAKIKAAIEYQACKEQCISDSKDFVFELPVSATTAEVTGSDTTATAIETPKDTTSTASVPVSDADLKLYGFKPTDLKQYTGDAATVHEEAKSKSLFGIFGLGFIGGLLALLTPCVFPLIPLTVSYFTKNSGKNKSDGIKKAILYGAFILGVYLLLSVPFHLLDSVNPDILNDISTNVWLNIFFFVIFIFFAFSFFGFYEITLPSSWMNKTTQGESIGGIFGIFFMALTLALVSFSCTGPILGSLLAGSLSSNGGAWQLTAGMGGFGLALGLPFTLFALFPNMMSSLPKSGGWLNTTKVVLGFLELALAFKFLSNADLVKHWGILKYETFMVLWIVIFAGLAIYLFGKIKFPHDSPLLKLSFFRIATAILVASFTIYLVSGFRVNKQTNTFTSLSLLSGLAPPVGYSYILPNDCPNNINCFKDLKAGLDYAKSQNKPVMIDFTGYACVNCRKMEENVWSDAEVDKVLKNDLVLISLYVDNKNALDKEEQIEVQRANGSKRVLENHGHKWAHFQTKYFQTNSQPYYVLLDPKTMQILNQPVSYTPDIPEYLQWLKSGLSNYKK